MKILSPLKMAGKAFIFVVFLCLLFSGFSTARSERGVEVRQSESGIIQTNPRKAVTLVFLVKNTSRKPFTFSGKAMVPDGWQVLTGEFPFSLKSGQQAVRLVSVFIPMQVQRGHYHVTYGVQSKEDPAAAAQHSVEIQVLLHTELQIVKMDEPKIVLAGQDYLTRYMITNKSNALALIRLGLENIPAYSYAFSQNLFYLQTGESHQVQVRVKTQGSIHKKINYNHRITARAANFRKGSVAVSTASSVEIIPVEHEEEDDFQRFPLELKFVRISDNIYGNQSQLGFSGTGALNESGTKQAQILLQGPGRNNLMTFGQVREEYRLSYTAPNGEIHIGDRLFTLSKLSNFGNYGRGIEGRVNINRFSIKAYQEESYFLPPKNNQKAVQLTFRAGKDNSFHLNYIRTEGAPRLNGQVLSLSANLSPNRRTRFHFEYAVGQGLENPRQAPSRAFWFESSAGYRWLSYRIDLIRATNRFPSQYKDVCFNSASFRISPFKQLAFNASYHDYKKNFHAGSQGQASFSQFIQVGCKLSLFKEAQFALESITRLRNDLDPNPQFHYRDRTMRLTYNSDMKNFNLLASYDSGRTFNYLTGRFQKLREYSASLSVQPFRFLSLDGNVRWRDQDKAFTGDKTRYSSSSLNMMIRFGQTSFSALYRTSYYQEFFDEIFFDSQYAGQLINNTMNVAQVSLTQVLPNHHTIGLHIRKIQSPYIPRKEGSIVGYLEYTIPIGVPVRRKPDSCRISGRIYDRNNYKKGFSGVIVRANGYTAVTDKSGKYVFYGLKPGQYFLTIDRTTLRPDQIPIQKMPMEINLQLKRKAEQNIAVALKSTLSGKVILYKKKNADSLENMMKKESSQKPEYMPVSGLANVLVEIRAGNEIRRQVTDSEGRFHFSEMRPGQWHLKIYGSNLPKFHFIEKDSLDIDLKPGDHKTYKTRVLPRTRTIRFRDSGTIKLKKNF